jgi:SAM-dependent methyltransferase
MTVTSLAPAPDSPGHQALFTAALRGEPCHVVGLSARPHPLPMHRWSAVADPSDVALLTHCVGATLDIGCGPGRMSEALTDRGACVLGIDVVPEAVALSRARGASALVRDVFGPVPGEGRWDTALLVDGNIGIGGDPVTLLERVRDLLAPGGRAVVEVARPGVGMRTVSLALVCAGARSTPFPWSVVGVDAVRELAAAAAMTLRQVVRHDDRWVAVLGKEA